MVSGNEGMEHGGVGLARKGHEEIFRDNEMFHILIRV